MAFKNSSPIQIDRRVIQKLREIREGAAMGNPSLISLSWSGVLELMALVFEHVLVWVRNGDMDSQLSRKETMHLITSFKPVFSGKVGRPKTKGEDDFAAENAIMPETPAELRILVESEVRKAFNRFQEMLPKDVQTRVIRKDEKPSVADMDPKGELRSENTRRVREWKEHFKEVYRRKTGHDGMEASDDKFLTELVEAGNRSIRQHGYLPSDYEPPPKLQHEASTIEANVDPVQGYE